MHPDKKNASAVAAKSKGGLKRIFGDLFPQEKARQKWHGGQNLDKPVPSFMPRCITAPISL